MRCKIEGCGKPPHGQGWCKMHHTRWLRHGDPLAGRTPKGELLRFYREIVLADARGANDPCLIWPYARNPNGYGHMKVAGRDKLISRLACEAVHGQPASSEHHAAHTCGRGNQGCVTPSHLRWATPKSNCADTLIHGTRIRGEQRWNAKLTESEAREIRELKGLKTLAEIGDRYGVSAACVSQIHARRNWGWL